MLLLQFLKIIILVLSIFLALYLIYFFVHCKRTNKMLIDYFKESSVIVYGPKGTGKDLLFQKVIYLKRKKPYLANISYGYKCNIEPIKSLSVAPNSFESFINEKITTINKKDNYEGLDYYISDAGVFLPAQYNGALNKNYYSLPIFYALSRHLYGMNIHMNSQYLNRAWNMLREQADRFIRCVNKVKTPFGIIAKIRMYDKYESACKNLLPMRKPFILNRFGQAIYKQYIATNGEIKTRHYFMRYKNIKYDTRVFHKIVFGKTYKEWKQETIARKGVKGGEM